MTERGPATPVLLIGAGDYPQLRGSIASVQDLGLESLSSPPISDGAVADWFLARGTFEGRGFHNPYAPLGSLELLVSPRRTYTGPAGEQIGALEPTFANIVRAYPGSLERLKAHAGNIGVFYFCGHGLMGQSDYLLPCDFGDGPNPWAHAIDITVTARAIRREVQGPLCFFIDACRQTRGETLLPGAAGTALGAVDFDTPTMNAARLVLWASGEGNAAFGQPGKVSRFTSALLEALTSFRGEPEPDGRCWAVTSELLSGSVRRPIETENQALPPALSQSVESLVIGSQPLHYQTSRPREVAGPAARWSPPAALHEHIHAFTPDLKATARETLAEELEARRANVESLQVEVAKWTQRYQALEESLAHLIDSAPTQAVRALLDAGRLDEVDAARLLERPKARRADAYTVNLDTWCSNPVARDGYIECAESPPWQSEVRGRASARVRAGRRRSRGSGEATGRTGAPYP